jgi:hypothetical protein
MAKVLQYIFSRVLSLRNSFWNEGIPSYFGHFDINYIILRSVEIFKKYLFQITKYSEINMLINYLFIGHELKWPRYYDNKRGSEVNDLVL